MAMEQRFVSRGFPAPPLPEDWATEWRCCSWITPSPGPTGGRADGRRAPSKGACARVPYQHRKVVFQSV